MNKFIIILFTIFVIAGGFVYYKYVYEDYEIKKEILAQNESQKNNDSLNCATLEQINSAKIENFIPLSTSELNNLVGGFSEFPIKFKIFKNVYPIISEKLSIYNNNGEPIQLFISGLSDWKVPNTKDINGYSISYSSCITLSVFWQANDNPINLFKKDNIEIYEELGNSRDFFIKLPPKFQTENHNFIKVVTSNYSRDDMLKTLSTVEFND